MDRLTDKRDLPLFIHSVIDDMTDLSPNAMRVYMHLTRRADKEGKAWPSYQAIGDHCFASVSKNAATRKTFARKAIGELVAAKLLVKEERSRDDGSQTSNGYILVNPPSVSTPMLISTPMPIDKAMLSKAAPVLIKQPPCLSSTEDTPSEDTPSEQGDEDDPHARDAVRQAWFDYYGDELPSSLDIPITGLVAETSEEAVIYGIRMSCENDARNFRYIAQCARNYLPVPPTNGQSAYQLPGVYAMPAEPRPAPVPPPPAPMAHSDPWAICLAELAPTLPGVAASYLTGSTLDAAGDVDGVPLYRVVCEARAALGLGWLTTQAGPAIRRKLSSILGYPVLIEIVAQPQAELEPAL